MTEYTNARALADRMLRKKGGIVTLTRTTAASYNTSTSTTTGPSTAIYTGSGVRINYALREIDGTKVLAGDVKFLISPKARDGTDFPQPLPSTDVITLGGRNYTVVNSDPLNLDGAEDVLFEVQARGIR